ncbi:MAG: TIGR00282 family metallophosphoesterase [Erysipelotrichaceae bacterium]|nr:TIGR00282 family metallophosphoesterase [Erysipelotrichaceae bacterium]
MNILFIGDIVGASGRKVVTELLPGLMKKHEIDLVIANGENSAHGKGITKKIYQSLISLGIDVITMGNHTFSKSEILEYMEYLPNMIRPANLIPTEPGKPAIVVDCKGLKVGVFNLCGKVFMDNCSESPFTTMERLLSEYPCDVHFVDIHAEATGEKIAFMRYFKDRLEVVVGTHTHVQTADEMIADGCAYITDAGMCGAYESVLGRDIRETLTRMLTEEKTKYTVADNPGIFCGVKVCIDESTHRAVHIERIQIRPE